MNLMLRWLRFRSKKPLKSHPKSIERPSENRRRNRRRLDLDFSTILVDLGGQVGEKIRPKSFQNRASTSTLLRECLGSVLGASWLQKPPTWTWLDMEREAPFFYCVSHFVPMRSVALLCVSLCFVIFSLCLADALLASPALRSRRSLRSLVRCARPRNMKNRGDM